ncbi:MAG TPA: phosphoribosylanthranilate isomerase [Rhabdaerophilum sp.]|nr:phosphoribosylanthranilate isomerase [Rhabdaerophilum sp.]
MNFKIKICGLKTEEVIEVAIEAGADMIGLNFHPKSPRYVVPETAAGLAAIARGRTEIVALVVDAGPGQLNVLSAHVSPDLWQLHGLETPTRCGEIKEWRRRPVMKALGVATPADLAAVASYAPIADFILLDAKPPKDAAYPGGHGRPFDWNILSALPPDQPFMLSGGLSPENVGEAIRTVRGMGLNLLGVDVSTGVESAPGVKDPGKIRAFVAAAREAGGS